MLPANEIPVFLASISLALKLVTQVLVPLVRWITKFEFTLVVRSPPASAGEMPPGTKADLLNHREPPRSRS